MTYEEWQKKAEEASDHFWSYPELIYDDPDSAKRAWEAGEDPAAYVKQLGIDLDLHEFGKAWGGW